MRILLEHMKIILIMLKSIFIIRYLQRFGSSLKKLEKSNIVYKNFRLRLFSIIFKMLDLSQGFYISFL